MRRERGASGVLIAVILVLIVVAILAVAGLSRTTDSTRQRDQTFVNLNAAASALDAYVSVAQRLPCPADPSADTGVEVVNGPTDCQFRSGTLPWQTIGMRRDDSFDAWGRKISYRVYTGNTGLTQAGGASMANCDTIEALPGGTTAAGLCNPVPNTTNPADRNTTPAQFLAGKGLQVTDMGAVHPDAAYVLISHGVTGLGGWTASGTQLDTPPNGPERDNTRDTGPFTIQAFSDQDTGVSVVGHFDDLLVYRGIEDLARRANLAARDWPDTILSSIVFDKNTVGAALNTNNPPADTGQATIAFNLASVTAFNSGGNQNVAFVSGGGSTDSIGGVSGGDGLLGSGGGEGLRIDLTSTARQFAFTLDSFDDLFFVFHERVEVRFYTLSGNVATLVATVTKQSCSSNGKVASFSIDPGVDFNRVELRPLITTNSFGFGNFDSSLSLAEIRTCAASVTCETTLAPTGNTCP